MQKVYAKNPTDEEYLSNPGEIILDNPAGKSKSKNSKPKAKDPRRVAAGKKAWRTRQRKQNNKTMSKRVNPKTVAETGVDLYRKSFPAALVTILSLGVAGWGLRKYGGNLPEWVPNYAPIAVPGIVGIAIASKAKKSNAPLQGAAGGMVFTSAMEALRKFLPDSITDTELSDAMSFKRSKMLADVDPSSVIVTRSGEIIDLNGSRNPGRPQAALPAPKPAPRRKTLQTAGSFESGESF